MQESVLRCEIEKQRARSMTGALVAFAMLARRFGTTFGFIPLSVQQYETLLPELTLERLLIVSGVLFVSGVPGFCGVSGAGGSTGFGPLEYTSMLRVLSLSLTAIAAGMQISCAALRDYRYADVKAARQR